MFQFRKLHLSKILTFLFCLVILTALKANSQDKIKNVVLFFSYGSNLPAFEKILVGLSSTIRGSQGEPVNIMTEYLDISRSVNENYSRFIIDMYNEKLNEFTIDLLITVGPGVNDALLKYGNDKLKGLNIINIDIDIPRRITLRDLEIKNGIEILLKFKAGKTLRHAFDLFPDYKDVFVISGVSRLDSFYTTLVRKGKNEFEPGHNFKFISNLTLDSTVRFVRTIPPKSIVFVPAYLQDAADVSFSTPEVVELISKNSRAPVFLSLTDGGFKGHGGGIGGYLFSYINLGKETGRIAHEILDGKQMQDITVDESNFYEHMYDWKELERWHLTDSKVIPANSVFYNKDSSFLELYKWYIFGILLFMLSQTLLIIYLYRLNKRQKAITEKMQVTESMHRELIHTDRLSKMSILTASLAHELFQPLAAIRFTAQAGKQFIQTDKFDVIKASQMFENILEDENRATKIIRSVKSLMKAETVDKENVNLNTLISETVDLIHAEAIRASIKINVVFEADPVFVPGDKIQLQQVLMNFIRNAITAMEKIDPQSKILEIYLKSDLDEAIVSVRDSGPGLEPIVKENLFKPFISTKKEGFGIGLTLCKSLIEKHNGKIRAENIPGGGAMFTFSLPVIKI
jgi:signal transduction histidine kinase